MSDAPHLSAEERWSVRVVEIAQRGTTIARHLRDASREVVLLARLDETLEPELAILIDCVNFGSAAAERIVGLMVERAKARAEEMRT